MQQSLQEQRMQTYIKDFFLIYFIELSPDLLGQG